MGTLKDRACGMSKERACNILAFMGFKPMISTEKYFPAYEISKAKALKLQVFMGFRPMTFITKSFPAYEISKEKALQILFSF